MRPSPRMTAILLAVLITFLWSTSWVLIKIGLRSELPPVSFAGLRYSLAFLCLVPFVLGSRHQRQVLRRLTGREWTILAGTGLVVYTLTQSLMYLSLDRLPSATLSLVLNLTSVFTALAGIRLLRESPTALQWAGLLLTVAGVGVYFLPLALPRAQLVGLLLALACMVANVAAALLGRWVNRGGEIPALIVTFVSMGVGAAVMLLLGGLSGGFGRPGGREWAILAWLALVNTALAFTLWNAVLRSLTAVEASILNSLMMPQIAVLSLLFLGETLTGRDMLGLALVFTGVVIVQIRGRGKASQA